MSLLGMEDEHLLTRKQRYPVIPPLHCDLVSKIHISSLLT